MWFFEQLDYTIYPRDGKSRSSSTLGAPRLSLRSSACNNPKKTSHERNAKQFNINIYLFFVSTEAGSLSVSTLISTVAISPGTRPGTSSAATTTSSRFIKVNIDVQYVLLPTNTLRVL